ncbi:hypothetical protein JI721_16975 [Alicyclobacillus cycloheptanicus]|uniref:Uncharacterized protein n=1 Tax=Alicyclobacillus cycloheptanicus TaxID=1457 RepID=A0ABT9XGB5_9BACL|nr:hypothetical protein [Alicyclobacillus cycloheptanicus]MDQ0189328.1 hypothetical protein [Alicyclobacillus cycloheptanicus]WDM01313.1 hypothetical protein JI721_16975 [Alicyclobacillus cycloheptanicus]
MSNQHTSNHNESFTFAGSLQNNRHFEMVVSERNRVIDDAVIVPIPWKQYHRANIPHLARHSR